MQNHGRNSRDRDSRAAPATRTDSPIRFRNAIQRDDAIGTLLDALGLDEMWGEDGPTAAGYSLASQSYYDNPDAKLVIMRAACRLYQLHGGRNCPRNPNIDIIRLWELPNKALALFGSLMVAMAGGYDDVDDWMDTVSPPEEEDGENNEAESDCNDGEGGDRETA